MLKCLIIVNALDYIASHQLAVFAMVEKVKLPVDGQERNSTTHQKMSDIQTAWIQHEAQTTWRLPSTKGTAAKCCQHVPNM